MHILLRNRVKVRSFSSQGEAKALVHALVRRIDYCNSRLRSAKFPSALSKCSSKDPNKNTEARTSALIQMNFTDYLLCLLVDSYIMEQNEKALMFYTDRLKFLG